MTLAEMQTKMKTTQIEKKGLLQLIWKTGGRPKKTGSLSYGTPPKSKTM